MYTKWIADRSRRLKHGLLRNLPQPFHDIFRTIILRLLYLFSPSGNAVLVAGKYPLQVEWERAAVDFSTFEEPFTKAFGKVLQSQQVVFDIGASIGEWSALAATFVGAENLHLFEPDLPSWRHIQKIFGLNKLPEPVGMFTGFAAAVDSRHTDLLERATARTWPANIKGIASFHDLYKSTTTPTIKIDTYCEYHKVLPTVIKIDVEGAEGEVLRGAENILREQKPTVFLSLHPGLVEQYNDSPEALISWLEGCGYTCELLGTDHEEHWLCEAI